MRYHLESTLPLEAFKPRGGRFSRGGMTLHGGGGGGFIGGVVNSISDAVSSVGDAIGGAFQGVEDLGQSAVDLVSDAGVAIDNGVNDVIPGGWGTVGAIAASIAAPYAAPYLIGEELAAAAAASGALQAGTAAGASAITSGIKGKSLEDTLKDAALSGTLAYGLANVSNGIGGDSASPNMNDAGAGSSGYGEANDLPTNLPNAPDPYVPDVPAPPVDEKTIADELKNAVDNAPIVPETPAPDAFNDGYNPNANPDIVKTPGIAGLQIIPPNDSYLGALPTGLSDSPVGYQFEGPNGTEIVGPNGKTYLVKDLQTAINSTSITAPADAQEGIKSLTNAVDKATVVPYDPMQASQEGFPLKDVSKYDPMQASQEGYPMPSQEGNVPALPAGSRGYEEAIQRYANMPDPYADVKPPASIYDKIVGAPQAAYEYLRDTSIPDMGSDLYNSVTENPLSWAGGALGVAGLAGQGPLAGLGYKLGTAGLLGAKTPTGGTSGTSGTTSKTPTPADYKYGSAGNIDKNYLLRNRLNAENIYSNAAGYRPVVRMADGGEVKHFGLGGIADAFTQVFQPIEKAVVRPVTDAVPFLKDVAPYAGMIAAPFIASPLAAAGVGALASGIGQGGFNMKRALMGGISAYGMSNLGAGMEAAGNMTPLTETEGVSKSMNANDFFRNPEMMAQGAENLTAGGDSYKLAAKNFATQAGLPSAAMAIMGQSGVSAVNEGIAQKAASDRAFAQAEAAQAELNTKSQSAKQRALDAIHAHPYMYAMGGMIPNPPDDQTGMPNQSPMSNFDGGMMNYAMGGYAMGGEPRFLSGGGDGMSDSIHASIDGNQEARLADGEFVIPADVVSHLGNGSSKAGAKQLYSMMDRVRQARTGQKKQGKQINPRKLIAA